jgi:diacylglycerol kinase (ATP)
MLVAPRANPADGFLDMMVIGDISKPDLLWSLPRVYRGTHLTHHKVTASIAREVETRPRHQMPLQADGELLGETLVARFHVIPAALNVVI